MQARLDRDQLVYGLPTDIPNNDWKPAPPDTFGRDWQTANGIDLGRPGEEPRYLEPGEIGKVFTLFTSGAIISLRFKEVW